MNRNSVATNILWRFAERSGAQIIKFVVSIILARMLAPEAYGTVALMLVVTSVLEVFVDRGLGSALVQKKNADDTDFSTVFFFNIAFCSALYLALFFLAPVIAHFYNDAEMTPYLRVLGCTVIISGVKNVQSSYTSKNMMFRKFFYATLGATIFSAVIGIAIAYMGGGVWALVAQYVSNHLVGTLILWFAVKWRPSKVFSFDRLKGLFSYGWKILASSLIATIYDNLRSLIIGKKYSQEDLAYYNRGQSLPGMLIDNINSSLNSVLFPVMSKVQDDINGLKTITRRSIKVSVYIFAPMMIGLAAVGEPLVKLLLTDKWLPCVPFMQIHAILLIFYPIHTANLNAIQAVGRSDLFLKLEILKKIVGLIALLCTMWISVQAMAYSLLVTSILNQIINSWPNKKLMNYSYIEQLKDILPSVILAVVMGGAVYCIQWLGLPVILTMIMQIVLGVAIYLLGSIVFRVEPFYYLLDMVKPVLKKVLKRS